MTELEAGEVLSLGLDHPVVLPVARDLHNGQFLFCDAVIQPHLKLRHREGNKTAFCAAAQSVQWLVG